jgi:hypothetical protein
MANNEGEWLMSPLAPDRLCPNTRLAAEATKSMLQCKQNIAMHHKCRYGSFVNERGGLV